MVAYTLIAQDYINMIESGKYTITEIQESAEQYFSHTDKGKGTGYKQFKRWEYNAQRMADENGRLKTDEFYISEWEKLNAKLIKSDKTFTRNNDFWTEMGPNYYSASTSWSPGVGRLTSFDIDPKNENHIIAGAETGGVWKTTDGANNWRPLMDFFSNIAVECVTMHPINQNIYYFGSTNGRIYTSSDAGATWTALASAGTSKVKKIAIHPQNPSIMYACVQNNGFYKSINGGTSWTKITNDGQGFDIEFKPGNPNTVYLSGSGVHISTDGGNVFNTIFQGQGSREIITITAPSSLARSINAIENIFNPGYIPIPVFPTSISGKLVSYDDEMTDGSLACGDAINGAALLNNIVLIERGTCSFVIKVRNAQKYGAKAVIIYNNLTDGATAMGGGDELISIPAIMINKDEGEKLLNELKSNEITLNLQKAFFPENSFASGAKIIGVSEAAPNVIYVLEASKNIFGGIYKSEDSGNNFVKLNHENKNYFGYSTEADDDRGQAPRNMTIAVHPQNADEVHIGGVLTFKSDDGGLTFSATSDWVPDYAAAFDIGYCHADICDMKFYGDKMYVSTDGGLYKASNTPNVNYEYFEDLTPGLGIRQFYKIGVSQTVPTVITGGSQDNGSSWYSDFTGWLDWLGADGMEGFVDKNNNLVLYGTSQNGSLYRKDEFDFIEYLDKPVEENGNWITPFEQDPLIPNTIYTGYDAVYKSADSGLGWTQISQNFGINLNHLKIAPSDNNIMFAAHGESLYKTTTGDGIWTKLSGFTGSINGIAIHPSDPNKVAIVTTNTQKIYVTKNGGTTWEPYRKNLPNFAALSLAWHGGDNDGLYIGMNFGVFYIDNTMQNWIPFLNNLPNVIVNELEINYAEGKLYAATYGRGLWVSPIFDEDSSIGEQAFDFPISVQPNPTADVIILDAAIPDLSDISVFNGEGKLMKYQKQIRIQNHQINVEDLASGLYYIRINHKNGIHTSKFVKL
jgi:photosystem II stability/assembly factor-like uncharacterized protein